MTPPPENRPATILMGIPGLHRFDNLNPDLRVRIHTIAIEIQENGKPDKTDPFLFDIGNTRIKPCDVLHIPCNGKALDDLAETWTIVDDRYVLAKTMQGIQGVEVKYRENNSETALFQIQNHGITKPTQKVYIAPQILYEPFRDDVCHHCVRNALVAVSLVKAEDYGTVKTRGLALTVVSKVKEINMSEAKKVAVKAILLPGYVIKSLKVKDSLLPPIKKIKNDLLYPLGDPENLQFDGHMAENLHPFMVFVGTKQELQEARYSVSTSK